MSSAQKESTKADGQADCALKYWGVFPDLIMNFVLRNIHWLISDCPEARRSIRFGVLNAVEGCHLPWHHWNPWPHGEMWLGGHPCPTQSLQWRYISSEYLLENTYLRNTAIDGSLLSSSQLKTVCVRIMPDKYWTKQSMWSWLQVLHIIAKISSCRATQSYLYFNRLWQRCSCQFHSAHQGILKWGSKTHIIMSNGAIICQSTIWVMKLR